MSTTNSRSFAAGKRSAAWSARLAREDHDRECVDYRGGHILGPRAARQARRTAHRPGSCPARVRRLQRQPRLAHSAGTREGQQSHVGDTEAVHDRADVVRSGRSSGSATAATRSRRQEPGESEVSGGKSAGRSLTTSWKRCSGRSRSLSRCSPRSLSATSARQLVTDQLARGTRDEHLPAVSGRADPRRAVHVQPDVSIRPELGLAGVDAHAHAHFGALGPSVGGENPLRFPPRRRQRRSPAERRRRTRHLRCRPRARDAAQTPRATGAGARRAPRRSGRASRVNRRVEPSMSLNRNVTVPLGNSAIVRSNAAPDSRLSRARQAL